MLHIAKNEIAYKRKVMQLIEAGIYFNAFKIPVQELKYGFGIVPPELVYDTNSNQFIYIVWTGDSIYEDIKSIN